MSLLLLALLLLVAGCRHGERLAATTEPAIRSGIRFTDVTSAAGIRFQHANGASGKKYMPETMGSGCAFIDYDNDGWQDILLINGEPWPDFQERRRSGRSANTPERPIP